MERGCLSGSRLNVGLPHSTIGPPPGFGALALGEEKYWWGPQSTPTVRLPPAAHTRTPRHCSLLPPNVHAAPSLISATLRCHAHEVAALFLPLVSQAEARRHNMHAPQAAGAAPSLYYVLPFLGRTFNKRLVP